METENTNTNEGSNVVTENAPDMNEFEQVQSVEEVIEETSEEKTTNEIINEKSKELQEVQNLPDDSNIQEPALETVNIEIQGANVSDVNEETKEEVINTNTETPTESIPEPNETIIESEIVVPSTEKNDETNKIENSTIDNQNKESLIVEEVVMTPPINNDELSKIDNVIMDQNVTEESPITEITNMPEEESQNTEMFEEQVNNIQNNYYSAVNNKNQNAKTSIMKPVGVENYKFSSEPRAIPAPSQRRKYRDPYELEKMLSIQKNEFNQEKQRM
ncbi:hypothetical protein BCR36DRAFT_367872 [Piromyces finnis]|uniref:Uncharacterized protein n=1 Tax=Piromyces finnis TaxID=1754191 RepID=A0A1Y1VIW4_9FUNG|nr:hypothetical protein BCR36DRAFT_367872 [Piromyces finnis]|eukprot:ORX56042.1 hypothetical protein BCR36DRAFT_367872 [Piromyces finnis]